MYHDSAAILTRPASIRASLQGASQDRTRVLVMGAEAYGSMRIHVQTRGVLDALQAALDEIRADMDRDEAADAGNELAAS